MAGKFDEDRPLGKLLKVYWADMQQNRGERAELSRAKSVDDIILLPAFQRACQRFKPFFEGEDNWESRLAAILGLLAHVRKPSGQEIALEMAGGPKPKDQPIVSELRFRRLLQKDRQELFVAMIRILRMLDNQANLHDLANSVYYWGNRTKRDWAFTYFPNTPGKASA